MTYRWSSSEPPHTHAYLWPNIVALLPPGRLRTLDVGCGNGAMAGALAGLGHEVDAIDDSESGIAEARRAWPSVSFRVGSCYTDLGGPYDLIVSTEVVEHLFSPAKALERMASALRLGGHVIVTTPYHGYLKNLALSVAGHWDAHHGVDWEGGHIKFFSERSLTSMLAKAGFRGFTFRNAGRAPYLWKSIVCRAERY